MALAITKGFADQLRIAYQNRPKLFTRRIVLPELLYERVVEIDELWDPWFTEPIRNDSASGRGR